MFSTILAASTPGLAQTRQYLDAPVIKSGLRLRLSPGTKTIQWAVDGDTTFRDLDTSALFLARTSFNVAYPALNPLRTQASTSAVAVDDPSFATITKLIESITALATTIAPQTPTRGTPPPHYVPPPECSNAVADIELLRTALYGEETSPKAVSDAIKRWIDAIDKSFASGMSGPQSMKAGIDEIKLSADKFTSYATEASARWKTITNCIEKAPDPQKGFYEVAALTAQDRTRLQQLLALQKATSDLSDLLTKDYAEPSKWTGTGSTDFIVGSQIKPTFDKMQNVTVKITSANLKVDAITSVLSIDQQAAGTAIFSVRRYSVLVPEVGVGVVVGTLKTPVYGTGKNAAGQIIVAQTDTKSLSVNPTILANFVCRCEGGLLAPMLQIGVATSKDLPAILLGGGLRLFGLGKGDVALGGGAMFGWYKDLQKLKVGDVVTGTSDINSDLGYIATPKVGGYISIQYKF
jgi:hypothetical protein